MSGRSISTSEEAKAEKPGKATAKAAAAKPEDDGFYAYIGPTVVGFAQSGTIYRNREDALRSLKAFTDRHPEAADFIVSGRELAMKRAALKEPESFLAVTYRKLLKKINRGG